jgi:hypothetical protein
MQAPPTDEVLDHFNQRTLMCTVEFGGAVNVKLSAVSLTSVPGAEMIGTAPATRYSVQWSVFQIGVR